MQPGKQPHILNASSNLLGICFVLITGMRISNMDANTLADEVSVLSAFAFLGSCLFSYTSLRKSGKTSIRMEDIADYLFMGGLFSLFFSVFIFSFSFL